MPDSSPAPPAGWFAPADRVPRRDQVVRVWTRRQHDRVARFTVAHTDDWPSGAGWRAEGEEASIPFGAVVAWSPDLAARYPAETTAEAPGPAAPPAPPAVLREVVVEVERTGAVLRRLPTATLDWSPHPSIPTLEVLALRLVRLVARIEWVLSLDSVELSFEPDLPAFDALDEVLATYLANEQAVAALVPTMTAADLQTPWTLERNGETIARLPRGDALRQFGLTPLVYHRGEAALLLTALGIAVPHPCPLWAFGGAPTAGWSGPAAGR